MQKRTGKVQSSITELITSGYIVPLQERTFRNQYYLILFANDMLWQAIFEGRYRVAVIQRAP